MRPDSGEAEDGGVRVTVGVDTHTDQHVGVALDQFGRRLGTRSVPTTPAGFAELVAWARTFGTVEQFGVEGTGSYGAGLTRWLRARGLAVIEVERPHRGDRQEESRQRRRDEHAEHDRLKRQPPPAVFDGQGDRACSYPRARRPAHYPASCS